ncbi:MAG: hypothetical protein QXG00_08215 [Candidatus Woesearchaeota archaeon]
MSFKDYVNKDNKINESGVGDLYQDIHELLTSVIMNTYPEQITDSNLAESIASKIIDALSLKYDIIPKEVK